ncbi:GNAT family N-acetyltransferase [Streptomyces profundus]|uniref:GNAT family N-acetyltransferase n=1 Tax=Streptomyces profundus TaxID=2867410 RepID=UPI001D16AC67|nr:GNAT family N-acetyltransferase [Streptomyces sp. MA3_2.13]UED85655.1 GNAT family N-acetyltransferase [Streptomyces sp. MA3_2.13]
MAYRIRQSRREDWEQLRELRLAALRDAVAPMAFFEPYEEAEQLTRGDWERRASGGEVVTFVGETDDGRWVGMVKIDTGGVYAEVMGVYLAPEHRGTGLGAQLMRAAMDWAGDLDVRLRVHQHNARAARFYRNLGFRPTGSTSPDPRDASLYAYELVYRRPRSWRP